MLPCDGGEESGERNAPFTGEMTMKRLGLVMVGLLASGAAEVSPKLELCRSARHVNSNHFINDLTWKILNLAESVTKIDMESADLIRQHANHVLERDYHQESQRAELQKQVVSTVEGVKMSRGNNLGDDVYQQFLGSGRLAVKILKREN
jgi:hypothetical protein